MTFACVRYAVGSARFASGKNSTWLLPVSMGSELKAACTLRWFSKGQVPDTPRSGKTKISRKGKGIERLAAVGTSFDLSGPFQEIYHPNEPLVTKRLFTQPGEFAGAAIDLQESQALNPDGVAEMAFVGKSNVGKSSLLNALMGTNNVKTSKSPGRTKGINFWSIGHDLARMVDLPGYGYARASKKMVKELHQRIYEYVFLQDPEVLRMVFLLVDVRRGMPDEVDLELMRAMDREGTRYRLVLTKADTVTALDEVKQAIVNCNNLIQNHLACDPYVHVVSAKFNFGVNELRRSIGQLFVERFAVEALNEGRGDESI